MTASSTLRGKSFQGPKVALPMTAVFSPRDVVISGKLLTLVKRKGFLFNCYSSVAFRIVTILCNGMLLVYDKERTGWTLDMKQMLRMKTTTMHPKKDNLRRLQLELKTDRGVISMVAIGGDAARWMDALSGVLKEPLPIRHEEVAEEGRAPLEDKCSTVTLVEEEGALSPLNDEPDEKKSDNNDPLTTEEARTTISSRPRTTYSMVVTYTEPKSIIVPTDSCSSEQTPKKTPIRTATMPPSVLQKRLVTRAATQPSVFRRLASPLPLSTLSHSSATESIRHGEHSVATLRNLLEARTRVSIRKARSSKKSTAGVPTAVVMAEERKIVQEEEEQTSRREKKKPTLRCRPSKSAPAAVAVPAKKHIVGNYNGCFDSSHA